MPHPLPHSFFDRLTSKLARDLIGCYLVRKIGNDILRTMITETEAYDGPKDLASHASRGKTERNKLMFGPAGYWYIYFVYGMHWMLNVTTGKAGYPAAVLIRGVISANGPAKLTKLLKISGKLNGTRCGRASGLWIEARDKKIAMREIIRSKRVGVNYAGPIWSSKKWRFIYTCV